MNVCFDIFRDFVKRDSRNWKLFKCFHLDFDIINTGVVERPYRALSFGENAIKWGISRAA